jgi:hypothetical protein
MTSFPIQRGTMLTIPEIGGGSYRPSTLPRHRTLSLLATSDAIANGPGKRAGGAPFSKTGEDHLSHAVA